MGISHEYHSTSHRARHGGVSGKLRLAGAVLAILVLAYAITAILENGASAKDAQSVFILLYKNLFQEKQILKIYAHLQ